MNVLNLTVLKARFKPSQIFMISAMLVNIGNYLYNLALGRMLGPAAFADAAILITFLLILSFLAMTIQLSVAKFTGSFDSEKKDAFIKYARKISLIIGSGVGFLIFIAAGELQQWFQTDSSAMFRIFALGVPLYFLMSVNRGYYQGEQEFIKLSVTYQGEMLS
ncbi:MAG: sugar isomerase, partial [Leeuwenhoekiella sp.]